MVSTVDPPGPLGHNPENPPPQTSPVTPKSRDVVDAARAPEPSEPESTKRPTLLRRLKTATRCRKKEPLPQQAPKVSAPHVAVHLTHDYQRQANAIHRRLPDEHVSEWQRRHARSRERAERARSPPQGPVPRRGPPIPKRRAALEHLAHDIDLAFLTPTEADVYATLRRVGRCAYFQPVVLGEGEARRREMLLVHASAVEPLRRIQRLARDLSDGAKFAMLRSLDGLLIEPLLVTLRRVLLRPDLDITATVAAAGVGVELLPAAVEESPAHTPTSMDFFNGRINPFVDGRGGWGARAGKKANPSIFTHFSQRAFKPGQPRDESLMESQNRPHLRGGGGGGEDGGHGRSSEKVLGRSCRAYIDFARADRKPATLADEERVPKAIWWFAGGRTRPGKHIPTAGELRQRRGTELENRKAVGFVGTVLGIRAKRKEPKVATTHTASESKASERSMAGESPEPAATPSENAPSPESPSGGEMADVKPNSVSAGKNAALDGGQPNSAQGSQMAGIHEQQSAKEGAKSMIEEWR